MGGEKRTRERERERLETSGLACGRLLTGMRVGDRWLKNRLRFSESERKKRQRYDFNQPQLKRLLEVGPPLLPTHRVASLPTHAALVCFVFCNKRGCGRSATLELCSVEVFVALVSSIQSLGRQQYQASLCVGSIIKHPGQHGQAPSAYCALK